METWAGDYTNEDHPLVRERIFNFESYKPGQKQIIEAALQGDDVFATLPTGSGKSLCIEIPIAMSPKGSTTLVLSPLIALMRSQAAALDSKGIPATDLHSGKSEEERKTILEGFKERKYAAVYLSPEQLKHPKLIEMSGSANISRVAIDEVHCLVKWGHDFRPDYLRIEDFIRRREIEQVLAFTATASAATKEDILNQLGLHEAFEYHGDIERPNLIYEVVKISDPKKRKKIITDSLKEFAPEQDDAVIIYCIKRDDTEELAEFLKKNGFSAEFYHAGLNDSDRKDREENFLNNQTKILVATNAFGMGMDKSNVRLIIHNSMPGSVDAYLQETGRAGRDGDEAHCIMIYHEKDREIHDYFIGEKCPKISFIKIIYDAIQRQYESSRQKTAKGWFPLNRIGLYKSFKLGSEQKWKGRSLDTMINAAIDFMAEAEIIEINGAYIKLKAFPAEDQLSELQAENKRRMGLVKASLEQILQYTNAPNPDQKMLIGLLNQPLIIS